MAQPQKSATAEKMPCAHAQSIKLQMSLTVLIMSHGSRDPMSSQSSVMRKSHAPAAACDCDLSDLWLSTAHAQNHEI